VAAAVVDTASGSTVSALAVQGQTADLVAFALEPTVHNAHAVALAASVELVQVPLALRLEVQLEEEERP